MRNSYLIKNLRKLQQISPNQNWAVSARADIVRMVNKDTISSARSFEEAKEGLSFLFTPLARPVFSLASGVLALFVVIFGSITLSMNSGIVFEDFNILRGQIADNTNTTKNALEVQKNTSPKRVATENPGTTSIIVEENRTYASIRAYDDSDMAIAMKAALRERINRLSVLGYEANDAYIIELANEADKLYQEGDYDAALRVITAAEVML